MRASQSQFETMIEYMEQHGDLSKFPPGPQARIEHLQKWTELTEMLNSQCEGNGKSVVKWRKAWSDLKNNTQKKVNKIQSQGRDGPVMNEIEKRVLQLLIANKQGDGKSNGSCIDIEENELNLKETVIMVDQCDSYQPPLFCTTEPETSKRRNSTLSYASSSSSSSRPVKRKKPHLEREMKDVTDKFFEFEREREKMAHEREMARIKQNDVLLNMVGRIVNVLETLTPSVKKCLDRVANEDG